MVNFCFQSIQKIHGTYCLLEISLPTQTSCFFVCLFYCCRFLCLFVCFMDLSVPSIKPQGPGCHLGTTWDSRPAARSPGSITHSGSWTFSDPRMSMRMRLDHGTLPKNSWIFPPRISLSSSSWHGIWTKCALTLASAEAVNYTAL